MTLRHGHGGPTPRAMPSHHAPAGSRSRVLLAVAPPPRLGNPTRWGWPHWLAPTYRAGGQLPPARPSTEEIG